MINQPQNLLYINYFIIIICNYYYMSLQLKRFFLKKEKRKEGMKETLIMFCLFPNRFAALPQCFFFFSAQSFDMFCVVGNAALANFHHDDVARKARMQSF